MFRYISLALTFVGTVMCNTFLQQEAWPPIKFYENFQLNGSMYTWDRTQLQPFKNTQLTQKFDAAGNRLYQEITLDEAGIGHLDIKQFTEFPYGVMWQDILSSVTASTCLTSS